MKANELMVGDWVQSDDKPYKYYAPYLNLNNDLSDGCWIEDSDCQRYFTGLTDIKPIPLTAEILEKNGFTQRATNQWYVDNQTRLDLGIFSFGIDDDCGVGFSVMPNDDITFFAKYIHELQHALRLCGLTVLADNFKV